MKRDFSVASTLSSASQVVPSTLMDLLLYIIATKETP